jgi:hypothetical protein
VIILVIILVILFSLFDENKFIYLTLRWTTLSTLSQLYITIGEPYLTLLPESMPYLFEILEDPDDQVEQVCYNLML